MPAPFKLTKQETPSREFTLEPTFHLLDLKTVPFELHRFQTCLRAWFLAYTIAFEEASATTEDLSQDAVIYQLLDDMLMNMFDNASEPDLNSESYEKIILDPIWTFSNELIETRQRVRNWFSDFVSVFDERADELSMKIHCYAFNTIDEYWLTYIVQRQQSVSVTN